MQALGSDTALLAGATLSGIRALFVAPFVVPATLADGYTYATDGRGLLTSLGPLTAWRVALLPGPAPGAGPVALASEEGSQSVRGWGFAQTVTLTGPGLSEARRAVGEALRLAGAVVALWQDGMGHWWLYGQQRGLRLASTKAQSSPASLALALAGTQGEAARPVADGVAFSLIGYTPPPAPGNGVVEIRDRAGNLMASVAGGRTVVIRSGFRVAFTIS